MKKVVLVLFLLLSLSVSVYSQEEVKSLAAGSVAGKLFTVDEANEQFGKVVSYSVISKSTLLKLAENYGEYLMFGFTDAECGIYDRYKSLLFGLTNSNKLDVYYVYSTSVILELLNQENAEEGDDEVYFEQREDTVTITYNGVTIENAFMCPPYC